MMRSRTVIELTVRFKLDSALAVRLTASVMRSGATLVASNCYRERDTLVYRLISEKPAETDFWLREAGFISRWETVVLVDLGEDVRAVQRLGGLLATAGISVLYSYSSIEAGGHTVVVFKTVNDAQALQL